VSGVTLVVLALVVVLLVKEVKIKNVGNFGVVGEIRLCCEIMSGVRPIK